MASCHHRPISNGTRMLAGWSDQGSDHGRRWEGVEPGVTCAACHDSELFYKGKRIRVDGDVATHFDIQAFFHAADDAMRATLHDSAKFDRLASRIRASSADAVRRQVFFRFGDNYFSRGLSRIVTEEKPP